MKITTRKGQNDKLKLKIKNLCLWLEWWFMPKIPAASELEIDGSRFQTSPMCVYVYVGEPVRPYLKEQSRCGGAHL
jgi:hypothetical protein